MAGNSDPIDLNTDQIRSWQSIITLIVFVLTNLNVLFPYHIPIYVPRRVVHGSLDALAALRVIAPRSRHQDEDSLSQAARGQRDSLGSEESTEKPVRKSNYVKFRFPMNFVTAPLIADLFLLALQVIGRKEVHDGTLGANHIFPIDIMAFFLTLAYIAISIDASGLIRYLAFKVLQWGGNVGHRLFLYLYAFFFGLGSFIGNDPIILSGTAFLAYMTRVSSNIVHPRAWIHTQFAVANIASAILVSSNPTNLVLAGAFDIKFIVYTANMIVPVIVTAIILFPFLLYIIFADEKLIPLSITMHELDEEAMNRAPVNPNIPNARGAAEEEEAEHLDDAQGKLLSLEEIMNPFLDKGGAAFGSVIMAVTLVTILALNAASQSTGEHPVFWVTLPAAFVMFCWDLGFGWIHREDTRRIAQEGRRAKLEHQQQRQAELKREEIKKTTSIPDIKCSLDQPPAVVVSDNDDAISPVPSSPTDKSVSDLAASTDPLKKDEASNNIDSEDNEKTGPDAPSRGGVLETTIATDVDVENQHSRKDGSAAQPTNLFNAVKDLYTWLSETFPTVMTVASHLPFALVPFAFSMFVLVQALVTKGWVPVFAHGWDHWVRKTGTVGAIGGMGFLSVVLCNFAGTNIGTTILLSRVIQAWQEIHRQPGASGITDRTFWATVYSMALGVNYGAFSTAFSAALAGLLWRDILERKHIKVRPLDFARVNLPIITIAMIVGCVVLVGEVYIVRGNSPYSGGGQ